MNKVKFNKKNEDKLNISDIENKALSLNNISKNYPKNFDLSEIDGKKNSNENNELSNFQNILLGTKKLHKIFIKKNEPEIHEEVRKTMAEQNFYLGNNKLNDRKTYKIYKTYTYGIEKKK